MSERPPLDPVLFKALEVLEKELGEADLKLTELTKIQERRNSLWASVTQLRSTLGMPPYVPVPHPLPPPVVPPVPGTTIWERTKEILGRAERPMELQEIAEALRGFNFNLKGRSGRETLRAILFKKNGVFERLADGTYKLKKD
jgi:hypothetical protein